VHLPRAFQNLHDGGAERAPHRDGHHEVDFFGEGGDRGAGEAQRVDGAQPREAELQGERPDAIEARLPARSCGS
jgi:hypothetical protein